MPPQPGYAEVLNEIKSLTLKLHVPMKELLVADAENLGSFTAEKFFRDQLVTIAMYFAFVDGELSDGEVAFFIDTHAALNPEFVVPSLTSVRECMLKSRQENNIGERFTKLETPPCISYLNIYDRVYSTDYAELAKAMFFAYANAIANADGRVSGAKEVANTFQETFVRPITPKDEKH